MSKPFPADKGIFARPLEARRVRIHALMLTPLSRWGRAAMESQFVKNATPPKSLTWLPFRAVAFDAFGIGSAFLFHEAELARSTFTPISRKET
jgi:hypothetical protein